MRVCLICSQIAAWGKIGGFGTATRALGGGLARRGVDVVAVVPRRAQYGQCKVERLDGMTVYGVEPIETLASGRIFRELDADIYHSQEPTLASWWAQKAVPERIHVVTCRDPRTWRDHLIELRYTNYKRRLLAPVSMLYEASPWVKAAVRRADAVLMPAPSALGERIRHLYGLAIQPRFAPYPVETPARQPVKSADPFVLFVGRFDRRKRVELFFELAHAFPDVHFAAVGASHDSRYDYQLRRRAQRLSNLHLVGFVPRFGTPNVSDYYGRAWVLVNTSVREGLPYTFPEAAAHGTAILSALDPEGFASRFGYQVSDGDYVAGLRWLLENNRWREKGEAAAKFVAANWNEAQCLDRHLELYAELTGHPIANRTSTSAAAAEGLETIGAAAMTSTKRRPAP